MSSDPDGSAGATPAPLRSAARSAVIRFTLSSLVALLVLTAGTILVADRIARHQALEYARAQGAGVAHRVAAPLVDADVRRDPASADGDLDLVMGNRMADGSLSHVKLWDTDGTIIWADDDTLVGRRFELEPDVAVLFGTTEVTAEVSDLSKEENVAERGEGELIEVYAGAFDADGLPLVFEAYLPVDRMEDDADTIVVAFVPLVVGALVLFLAVVLPLAVSLTRRLERAQVEQSKMMRHALFASDLERRRIAADLHDGVIQDLAGLGYVLPSVTRQLDTDELDAPRTMLERATSIIQHDTALLRSLMTDLYPPDLEGEGLREAIEELVQSEVLEGDFTAEIDFRPHVTISHEAGRLVYRIVREALRNVVKHARADHVLVEVTGSGGRVSVRVQDDGRGPGDTPGRAGEGHLGLRLLRDTVVDFGGSL
jgi:signal transduction histidine kinase